MKKGAILSSIKKQIANEPNKTYLHPTSSGINLKSQLMNNYQPKKRLNKVAEKSAERKQLDNSRNVTNKSRDASYDNIKDIKFKYTKTDEYLNKIGDISRNKSQGIKSNIYSTNVKTGNYMLLNATDISKDYLGNLNTNLEAKPERDLKLNNSHNADDQIFTNYKKLKKYNNSNINNLDLNNTTNINSVTNTQPNSFAFDRSNNNFTIKNVNQENLAQKMKIEELSTPSEKILPKEIELENKIKSLKQSEIIYRKPESFNPTKKHVFSIKNEENELIDYNKLYTTSKFKKISYETKDSFSFLHKNNSTSFNSNKAENASLKSNKETPEIDTRDSIKKYTKDSSKLTHNTQEELKDLLNEKNVEIQSVEELHFVFVNLLKNSKNVIKKQEHIQDYENIFSTVSKCDEIEL